MPDSMAVLSARMRSLDRRHASAPIILHQAPPPAAPGIDLASRFLLRPWEAAKACGVSGKTFAKWKVPRVEIDGVVGHRPADIAAFISAHLHITESTRMHGEEGDVKLQPPPNS